MPSGHELPDQEAVQMIDAPSLLAARRQRLTAEVERCHERGDRRGLADAAASLRILGYLFSEEVPARS